MDNLNIFSLATVFVFSTLNESIIEYVFGNVSPLKPYLSLIGLLSAILLTFIYQINLLAIILDIQTNAPFLDFLLSGFIISRISNFINDLAQRILKSK